MNRFLDLILRTPLRTQLYLSLGFAVALTFIASLVALVSFQRVGEAQRVVNEGSVPNIAAAFLVAQDAQSLAGAAPRLTVARTEEALRDAVKEISKTRIAFTVHVDALAGDDEGENPATRHVRERGTDLLSNLDAIEDSAVERFVLAARSQELRDTLRSVETNLTENLVTAIDNQLFYALTGHRDLQSPPAPLEAHFTTGEVNKYRRVAELYDAAAIGTQVLANAFSFADRAQLEPLRERFEAATRQVQRNLRALGDDPIVKAVVPMFDELITLSVRGDGIFAIRESELDLETRQRGLLGNNRAIATALIAEVERLVSRAREGALEATSRSQGTITTSRRVLLVLNIVSIAGAFLIAWGFVGKVLLRRLEKLSGWMHRMAQGDLESKVEIRGQDEVAEMAAALEVFRRHALEVQRLNLVEKLADELKGKNSELESVLDDLQAAQGQIVMREKLAALGELTAGVAHEIKNPLNFVKNFSEVSEELIEELDEILPDEGEDFGEDQREEVHDICQDLTENLKLIRQHGDRANRIVHDMLKMGRDAGDRYEVEVNLLVKEHSNLAYHSARAADSNFQLDIVEDFGEDVGSLECIPQDLARVILNLVSNACYATDEKRKEGKDGFAPTVKLETRRSEDRIVIRVHDNGNGMPPEVQEKIFNPFFTTKPTNQGTGLGLSLSNDIVREHGGELRVESKEGEYTIMSIDLPVQRVEVPVAAEAVT